MKKKLKKNLFCQMALLKGQLNITRGKIFKIEADSKIPANSTDFQSYLLSWPSGRYCIIGDGRNPEHV
jgi:hypothetical protein